MLRLNLQRIQIFVVRRARRTTAPLMAKQPTDPSAAISMRLVLKRTTSANTALTAKTSPSTLSQRRRTPTVACAA